MYIRETTYGMHKVLEKPEANEKKANCLKYFKKFKAPGKQLFWVWIAYQCIKGTITTTVIWIPALYYWMHFKH